MSTVIAPAPAGALMIGEPVARVPGTGNFTCPDP